MSSSCLLSQAEKGQYWALGSSDDSGEIEAKIEPAANVKGNKIPRHLIVAVLGALTIFGVLNAMGSIVHSVEDLAWRRASSFDDLKGLRRLHGSDNNSKHLRVAMMVDKPSKGFCRSLFSLLSNGYEAPQLLNFGKGFTHGLGDKVLRAHEHLAGPHVNDHDVFAFIDGSDILFQLPEKVMLERYRKSGYDVLLSAEKNCYPYDPDVCGNTPKPPLPKKMYGSTTDKMTPDRNSRHIRPQYANSGAMIGTSRGLREYFQWAKQLVPEIGDANDQAIMGKFWTQALKEFKSKGITYGMDYRSSLLQSMWTAETDVVWEVNPDSSSASSAPMDAGEELYLDVSDLHLDGRHAQRSFWHGLPLMRNKVSNVIPALMHFNGNKEWLPVWWRRMWFSHGEMGRKLKHILYEQDGPGQAGAWDGEVWHPHTELCAGIEVVH